MFDNYAPASSRFVLSEPTETTKMAVANAEHAIDCALHYVQFNDAPQLAVYAGKALTYLRDAHSASLALAERPQLIAADRDEISDAVRDLVTAQVILAEVVSMARVSMSERQVHSPEVAELMTARLSRARDLTCTGFQHLDEVPVIFRRCANLSAQLVAD